MNGAGSSSSSPSSSSPRPLASLAPIELALSPFSAATLTSTMRPTAWEGDELQRESGLAPLQTPFLIQETEATAAEPLQVAPLAGPVLDDTNARRRRAYGQRHLTDDLKRERNRETFKRFYHRKQQTLRELRQEEEQLTAQYQQLKLARQEIAETTNATPLDASLFELVTHKDELSAEHLVLQKVAQEQLKTRRMLARLVDSMDHQTEPPQPHPSSTKHLRLPPPLQDTHTLLREAMQQLSEIQSLSEIYQADDAVGWQCWSQTQNDHIAFRVTKQFPSVPIPLDEAARRTWQFYSEPKSSGSAASAPLLIAPSSQVRIHRRVLSSSIDQEGRETRLVYRQLTRVHRNEGSHHSSSSTTANSDSQNPRRSPLSLTKSVYVVTLTALDTPGGYCVVSRSVPNQEAYDHSPRKNVVQDESDLLFLDGTAPCDVHVEWIKELTWWRIEPTETGVTVSYSGRAHVCLALSPNACFMEMLRLVVQWEDAVLGATPIFCLDR